MSNLLFISSALATIIWIACFLFTAANPVVHLFLVAAFIGTLASVLMDETNKPKHNYK